MADPSKQHLCSICGFTSMNYDSMLSHKRQHKKDKIDETCSECKKHFTDKFLFKIHIKEHDDYRHFVCDLCGQKFITKKGLRIHETTHEVEENVECPMCRKKFDNWKTCERHQLIHEVNKEKYENCNCVYCEEELHDQQSFFDHMLTHPDFDAAKGRYGCPHCGYTNHVYSSLVRHIATHSDDREFQCKICQKTYRSESSMKYHEKRHGQDRSFPCHVCGIVFKDSPYYLWHLDNHYDGNGDVKYACKYCNSDIEGKENFQQHYLMHFEQRQFQCDLCSRKFPTRESLLRHKSSIHSDSNSLNCKHCDKCFNNLKELRDHTETHENERILPCRICDVMFTSTADVCQHEKRHKTKDGSINFNCHLCERKMTNKEDYKVHYEEHYEQRRYQCEFCNLKFFSRGTMGVHRMKKHKALVQCEFCSHQSPKVAELRLHERESHPDERLLHCKYCDVRVFTSKDKAIHEKQHFDKNGVLRFKCEICGKKLKDSDTYVEHYMEHQAERPYKCQFCTRRFESNANIKQHNRDFHSDVTDNVSAKRTKTNDQTKKQKIALRPVGDDKENQENESLEAEMTTPPLYECSELPLTVVAKQNLNKYNGIGRQKLIVLWMQKLESDSLTLTHLHQVTCIICVPELSSRENKLSLPNMVNITVSGCDGEVRWCIYGDDVGEFADMSFGSYDELESTLRRTTDRALLHIMRHSDRGIFQKVAKQLTSCVILTNKSSIE